MRHLLGEPTSRAAIVPMSLWIRTEPSPQEKLASSFGIPQS